MLMSNTLWVHIKVEPKMSLGHFVGPRNECILEYIQIELPSISIQNLYLDQKDTKNGLFVYRVKKKRRKKVPQ